MPNRLIDRPFVLPMLVLGLCLLLTGVIFSWSFYAARNNNQTISVTGSAKADVKADDAKWTISVYATAYQDGLSGAYNSVAADMAGVKAYFAKAGVASSTVTTITADQDWSKQNGPTQYNVHQEITIESSDVDKVAALAGSVQDLINRGYSIQPRQPEYYVSNLPQLRVSLLGEAVADAKSRAESIAKSGGASVGALASASSGVVQVLAPNSTNVEDYGSYDTSTINKEVSVTARAAFYVK